MPSLKKLLSKRIILSLLLMFIFALMLIYPGPVFTGASTGLLLWFNIVLPTLFPFILICNLLIHTKTVDFILHLTRPLFCRFFGVSSYGSFAVLSGFLCGYPMGAKVTADLYLQGAISRKEADYLLSFCNNTSPMFILSFLVMQNLKENTLKLPTIIILLFSPILCSFLFRFQYSSSEAGNVFNPAKSSTGNNTCSKSDALDFSISNALESITKVGAYIIIFSIFTELAGLLPYAKTPLHLIFLASLEVTNGITLLCNSDFSRNAIYILCLMQTSFGGLCAIAQTYSMIKDTGLPICPYILKKLITALVTSLLAFIYLYFF